MKRIVGARNNEERPPSIQDASDRVLDEKINKRGESVEDINAELCKYKEQIKRTRPGPAQEAIKSRAMRVLKQKKMYEGQRDMLYNQTFNLDHVSLLSDMLRAIDFEAMDYDLYS